MRPPDGPGLLMVGFEGKSLPPRLARQIRGWALGGVVLFSRNVETPRQVRDLCREIRAAAGGGQPAPLIAIDQEGGRVMRLTAPGFTRFPPARCYSLFRSRSSRVAGAAGEAMAEELRAVGVDINFAPVLDVDSNPENPVIGDRALSSDPESVAELGIAFSRGMLSRGVLPVGKHFPGHGNTASDSHGELPVVRSSRAMLLKRDVSPFRRAIQAGIPALMTAHVLYPALDREFPATLSEKILGGLLRKQLRFRGAVFSDALEMKAITGTLGIGDAAVRAVSAGCDVVLVCAGEKAREEAGEAIARAWTDDGDFRRAARASIRRVERLREFLSQGGAPRPARRASLRQVGTRRHRELSRLLFARWESSGQASRAGRSGNIGEG
ncbi:MAG TPA: beta-N-acetylhexosaminidase [Candidatus Deferrimicrobiaceae bacterium]|nr:beta-N-acetylhexosaminidase [Candidatus Deferrimicrobiaceae bacterium]